MGCDIHLFVERQDDSGKWGAVDRWEPNKHADEEGEPAMVLASRSFYDDRNYGLFAILADVRNGYGFAGCDTGDGFVPIAPPRGLPSDVSPEIEAESDEWGVDGHSHSHFTVAELLAYDWTQFSTLRGFVNGPELDDWSRWSRGRGNGPRSYCGDIGGGAIRKVSEADLASLNAKAKAEGSPLPEDTYAQVSWSEPYHKCASDFWSFTIPRLLALGAPDRVRIVFWFDN